MAVPAHGSTSITSRNARLRPPDPAGDCITLTLDRRARYSYVRQLKSQIISQIHFGQMTARARLPSVRQLAGRLSVNPKTVRKVYQELHAEGYLDIRPRVGASVRLPIVSTRRLALNAMRLRFARRSIREASVLGLSPAALAELIRSLSTPARRRSATVVVVECNREQMRWYSRQIEQSLNTRAYEVLLDELERPGADLLQRIRRSRCFVTTHYHWEEVCRHAVAYERPVLQIRLNPHVFDVIGQRARTEPIGLVGVDRTFLEGFTRALAAVAPAVPRHHVRTAEVTDHQAIQSLLDDVGTAFVSPLCADQVAALRPRAQVQVLSFENIIASESLETIEAVLIGE